MGQRDMHNRDAQLQSSFRRATVKSECRPAVEGRVRDLYLLPVNVAGVLGSCERFVGRLFRREPGGKVPRRIGATVAVVALAVGEEPSTGAFRMPTEQKRDTVDVGEVEPDPADHFRPDGLRRRIFRQSDALAPRESARTGRKRAHTSSAARKARCTIPVQRRHVSNCRLSGA